MTLTLKIVNHASLDNGSSTELVLNNRGAKIGRSMTCEWILPDDTRTLSGKHCEIRFQHEDYFLVDEGSTNGTFLADCEDRIVQAHKIAPGDRFRIGPYVVEARLSGAAKQRHEAEQQRSADAGRAPGYSDWADVPGGSPAAQPPPPPQFEAEGGWDLAGEAPDRASNWSEDASRGSSDPGADEIFNDFTAKNEIDWSSAAWTADPDFDPFAIDAEKAEAGFAPIAGSDPQPDQGFAPIGSDPAPTDSFTVPPAPSSDPFGGPLDGNAPPPAPPTPPASPPPSPMAEPAPEPGQQAADSGGSFAPLGDTSPPAPVPAPAPVSAPVPEAHDPLSTQIPAPQSGPAPAVEPAPPPVDPPQRAGAQDAVYAALLRELGVPSGQLTIAPDEVSSKAGRMLRRLLAGLMILLEARARAKDEMGAAATSLGFEGNNPLKFARNVDQALQMMLNPKMTGYMESEAAIEEAYRDLQAHQIATLKAMQGALKETLNRFSPTAIKARTKEQGLLAKVLPGQREAALWKAYESQFSGVAEGSAEAFLEVFSKEFRKAYEEASRK